MKNLFLVMVWIFIAFSSTTYWYELNANDTIITTRITNRIEDSIAQKWEKYRDIYIKKYDVLQNKYKNSERVKARTTLIKENIKDNSRILIQNKILAELDKKWLPDFSFIYSTGALDSMPSVLLRLLDERKKQFHELINTSPDTINFDIIENYNQGDKFSYLFWLVSHYDNVHSNEQTRYIIELFQDKYTEFNNEISFSRELYSLYKTAQKDTTLNSEQLRVVNKAIQSFELAWVNQGKAKIARLKQINQELAKLQFQFWKNLVDEQKEYTYYIDSIDTLKEMPADILEQAHEYAKTQNKDGYLFNYNTASNIITYCSDESARKAVRSAFKSIASSWKHDNREIILKILKLRQELASILGYKNYWEYSLANKMAPSPEFVINQEDQILVRANEKANKEIEEITKYFNLTKLEVWDYSYYSRKLQEEKYQLDDNALRDYFEFGRVKEWLFDIAKRLYWVELKRVDSKMYDEGVEAYEIYKDWALKWYYILDPFYNPDKASWAWSNPIRIGEVQRSSITLNSLNISKVDEKTLLTYYEVIVMFHEFWHALSNLLSESKYPELNWAGIEWDFVELSSQLMENWATNGEWLKTFAFNYKTWERISDELLEKIKKADTFSTWVWTAIQILYSRIDMTFHTQKVPNNIDELDKLNYKVVDSIGIFKNDTANKMYTSFSHIFNWWYAAGYYSYHWAEIIESDIFSKFSESGIFNKDTATRFYNTILSQWTRKPALELFKDFMWRDIQLDGFYKKKGF